MRESIQIHFPPCWLSVVLCGKESMFSLKCFMLYLRRWGGASSCISLVLILSSFYFLRGYSDRGRQRFCLFLTVLFIVPHCSIPRHHNRERRAVHSWLIKHVALSVAFIDIPEPPSNLLDLYLLVFRASVLSDQSRLLLIQDVLWQTRWLCVSREILCYSEIAPLAPPHDYNPKEVSNPSEFSKWHAWWI